MSILLLLVLVTIDDNSPYRHRFYSIRQVGEDEGEAIGKEPNYENYGRKTG